MPQKNTLEKVESMIVMDECSQYVFASDTGLSQTGEALLERKLKDLQDEDERLSEAVVLADTSKDVLESAIKGSRNHWNSSTAQLPAEVLGKIFESARIVWTQQSNEQPAEVILSQVCTQWRNVALGLSTLWTNIDSSSTRPLYFLQIYLTRSRSRLLSVSIDLRHNNALYLMAWQQLVEHIDRWQRLTVMTDSQTSFSAAYKLLQEVSPRLEELHISFSYMASDHENENHWRPEESPIFRRALPNLRYLYINYMAWAPLWLTLSTITTLCIHSVQQQWTWDEDFRPMISGLVSLENLSIYQDPFNGDGLSNISQTLVPALRSLRLRCAEYDKWFDYEMILSHIIAPSLEILHLVDWHGRWDMGKGIKVHADGALRFPKLQSLFLVECKFSLVTFRAYITTYPSLKFLTCVGRTAIDHAHSVFHGTDPLPQTLEAVYICNDANRPTSVRINDWTQRTPALFYANLASFNDIAQDSNFMHFSEDFPRWQKLQTLSEKAGDSKSYSRSLLPSTGIRDSICGERTSP